MAALESAVHLQVVTVEQARTIVSAAPRRIRRALREIEFGAQSGYETLVRLRLRRLGYDVRLQARVPGVGHLDLLVEGLLAVEVDGARWHEGRAGEDHRRDVATEGWGIRVLRISPEQIDSDWLGVVGVIERMLADARLAAARR